MEAQAKATTPASGGMLLAVFEILTTRHQNPLANRAIEDLNAIALQLMPPVRFAACAARVALAGYLLACVVFLGLLSAGLQLHLEVHENACDSDHQCVITLFAHGQVELTDTACDTREHVTLAVLGPCPSEAALVPVVDFLLLPGRAPPAFC